MVQSGTTTIVVDTGPDFNTQLTRENIKTIDAVLYTHAHSDHVAGMDDLRILKGRADKRMPIFADQPTITELRQRFGYIFEQVSDFYPAVVDVHLFQDSDFGREFHVGDISFIPFVQDHGQGNRSLGFRFGDFGYSTDMVDLDDQALSILKGVKVWIADCADYAHGHGTLHSTFPNVQRLNGIIGAGQVYLTHLKMFYDYQTLCRELPEGYLPAHDGLVIG